MKPRIALSFLLLLVLISSLIVPAVGAQAPTTGADTPAADKGKPEEPQGPPIPLQAGITGVSTDYGWSQTTGTYTEISGGTQLTTSCDDDNYNAQAIPFTFTFNGTAYTQFSLNCNGFIAMGATVSYSYTPISSGTSNNVVAALGGDQQANATNSEIRYETLGAGPNRVLVIQWKNFRHYGATGDLYNYQIRLYETSNLVEVVYGPFTQNATARTSQVGLRGASSADFNNRSSTGSWTSSVAGTVNTATMALTTAYVPPSGLTWDWTPIPPHPIFDTSYKTAPAQVVVGNPIAYTVHIKNSGTAPANSATLVDPIPAGATYNGDVTCPTGTCGFDGTNVTWAGTVAVGGDETVSFSVGTAGIACGSTVVNQATLNDPGLFGGAVTKSVSTKMVGSAPTPLDGFEVSVPPPGWTETIVYDPGTDPDWSQVSSGTYPTINPHGGTYMAKFNSFSTGAGGMARLGTGALDLSAYAAPAVVFWMSHDTAYSTNADRIQMQVSTDGVTWIDFGVPVLRYDAACTTACWKEHVVLLPVGYNVNGVYIGFLGISAYGNNFYLDDTALTEGWYPCPYFSVAPDASKTSCPGSSVEYALTVTNMVPNGDTFDLSAAGNAWPTALDPVQLVLGPGGIGSVDVTVDVPWAGGTDTAVVTALGQAHGATDSATLVTTGSSTYWEQVASEPDNGRMDNVVGAYNGLVWSITGYGLNRNVRTYNPATNTWTTVGTPPTFTGNYAHSGCQAGSKMYMYGDASTAGFTGLWSYDMATTTWMQETPAGTAPAYTGIWAPAWAHDADTGYCYLTGGASVAGAGNLTSAYVYDPATNAWLDPLPTFTTMRGFHAAWAFTAADGRHLLCVAGGSNSVGPLSSTQCYDLAAGAWGAENADLGALPADLWGMGYTHKVHEGDTQLWVTGGVRAGFITALTTYFDVAAGTWVDDGNLAGAVYRMAAVTLDDEMYAVGGSIGSFSYTGLANHHVQCVGCAAPSGVDFAWDPSGPLPGQEVTFTGTAMGTEPLEYAWDLGDGATATGNPAAHTYAAAGDYLVTLTVSNACGSDSAQHTVTVSGEADISVSPASLSATLCQGATGTQTLHICNEGVLDLTWTLSEEPFFGVLRTAGGAAPRAPAAGATGSRAGTAGAGQPIAYKSVASFSEGFDDITLLPGQGWYFQNNSEPLGLSDWFQGNDAVFPAHDGAPTAYIAANYNNVAGIGTISNWMLTPEISLNDGDVISFWTRVPAGSIWPDRLELRLSTAGASTDVGATATSVGDFTTLLLSVNPDLEVGGYPEEWTQFSATLAGIPAGATGRIAFRYFVTDGGPSGTNSNYIGVDTLEFVSAPSAGIPWLSENPTSGTVPPGECADVVVTFDSTGLAAGDYSGNLLVDSNDPDEPTVTVPVDLTVNAPPSAADFGWSPPNPIIGDLVTFTGTAQGSEPLTYAWDFGDGNTGSGPVATHIYAAPGDYLVTLTVTNDCGQAVVQHTVTVAGEPDISVSPASLLAEQCPDTITTQTLQVCNEGELDLTWTLNEAAPKLGSEKVTLPARAAGDGARTAAGAILARSAGTYTIQGRAGINTPPSVLLAFSDYDANVIQALLQAYGDLAAVDLFDAANSTPTLAELQAYDVVVTWSNFVYADPTGIGNVLADYVDVGGKVIDLMFAMGTHFWQMAGRFMDEGYTAMNGTNLYFGDVCLGTYDPSHPIMAGVTNVCEYYRMTGTYLTAGSSEVAQWADGLSFVAAKDNQTVVSINGYVGSAYQWTGQMADVVHNAILWLAVPSAGIPWLSEDPTSGTVAPGECQDVTVTFDSTGLDAGDYFGNLVVDSNDPDEPAVTVPVQLTVDQCASIVTCGFIIGRAAMDPYGRILVRWWVQAADQADSPLAGVQVTADMTWPDGGPATRTRYTHQNGLARFHWGYRTGGEWTIDVTDMVLAGYTFQDGPNCSASGNW